MAYLEGVVEVFEYDNFAIRIIGPQSDRPQGNAHLGVDRAATKDKYDSSLVEQALHAHKGFRRRKVDSARRAEIDDQVANRVRRPVCSVEDLSNCNLDVGDGAEKEEALQLDDADLAACIFEERGLDRVAPHARLYDVSVQDSADGPPSRGQDDERDLQFVAE